MRILIVILLMLFIFGCTGYGKSGEAASPYTNITKAYDESTEHMVIPAPHENVTNETGINFDILKEKVIPSKGVVLKAKWNNVGVLAVGSGGLNISKFEAVMQRNGKPITDYQYEILQRGSERYIVINATNSHFILNLFWAFGLANKNPVLENGTISRDKVSIPRYASTGGWPLGNANGGQLFASTELIKLDERQQKLVEEVVANTYRPCCNNPTSFPDCNHGMAALGLTEWMAYQNASKEDIYAALLASNSYWFPQTYVETAAYFESQNQTWENISPKEILSANYSSSTGYYNTKQKLSSLPDFKLYGGGCGA